MGLVLAYLAWGVRGSYPMVGSICGVQPAVRERKQDSQGDGAAVGAGSSGVSMQAAGAGAGQVGSDGFDRRQQDDGGW